MRIRFRMSGGVGGLFTAAPLSCDVSTEDLPEPAADQLRRLVDESGLLEPGTAAPAGPGRARDLMHYRLEITAGGYAHRYDFDDTTVPPAARPLVDHLAAIAMRRRTGGTG